MRLLLYMRSRNLAEALTYRGEPSNLKVTADGGSNLVMFPIYDQLYP